MPKILRNCLKICWVLMVLLACSIANVAAQESLPESLPETGSGFLNNTIDANHELLVSLDDCVKMALLNNKEIRASDYDIEAAQWRLREAKAGGMPVVEYSVELGPAPTDIDNALESMFNGNITLASRFRLELGIPVYTFGKLAIAQSLAKDGVQAERVKKEQKENEIVVKVKKLYWGILLARDLIALLKEAEGHLSAEIRRKESDEKEPPDPVAITKLKLFRFETSKKLYEAEQKEQLAVEGLRITLGVSKNYSLSILNKHLQPANFNVKEFQSYLTGERKNNPDEKLLNIGLQAKEKQYRLEKRALLPDIGAGGLFEFGVSTDPITGLAADDDFNNPFNFVRAAVGVRLRGKLDINGQVSKIKRTQAEYYSAALKKSIAKEGLELDLRKQFEEVKRAKQELEDSDKGRQLARQLVFLTKSNLDIGIGEPNEYADALKQYLIMRGRYLESTFNYNTTVAELEAKIQSASELVQAR